MQRSAAFSSSFWSILRDAKGDYEALKKLLIEMSKDQIRQFHDEFRMARRNLWASPAYDILAAVRSSDDTIEDVFIHVVGQGNEYYDMILDHPDLIPVDVPGDGAALAGAARMVYLERFAEDIDRPD